jgi:hypothetical protein
MIPSTIYAIFGPVICESESVGYGLGQYNRAALLAPPQQIEISTLEIKPYVSAMAVMVEPSSMATGIPQ